MNPVQFKVSSVEDNNMTKVKGMTVFNTEQVNTKKQPMFSVNLWEFRDTIHTNIQSSTNLPHNN